ncbi:GNAT family N-acetyltransferase [Erwinia sp. CPCC 100877]|nr:GNAT family N-acetyltransferase [Erwinia sp. CPCC 100877]
MSDKNQFIKKRIQPAAESSFYYLKPQKIRLNDQLRLVLFDGVRSDTYHWYQDPESMKNIVGKSICYTKKQIDQMYQWQNKHGWLYYIEYKQKRHFLTIGDVWLGKTDYAIVIDGQYRANQIGHKVTKYFIHKSRQLGREYFLVSEIFNWNKASQKMFTRLKFYPYKENKDSWSYRKKLL